MLEKTRDSPLDLKEIKPASPKGNQSWIFIGKTDAEDETPILWPPNVKNWLIGKDPDAGNDWRREEKGMTGWDGCMASPTWWTWIWVSSRSWWWTGNPGMLQSVGSQRVRHDWAAELNWYTPSPGEEDTTHHIWSYGDRVNDLGVWEAALIVLKEWQAPWFPSEHVIGLFE